MHKLLFMFAFVALTSCGQENDEGFSGDTLPKKKIDLSKLKDETVLDTYCNERFQYCISYPAFFVFPQPESDNGDGRSFTNKEGAEVLRVFGKEMAYGGGRRTSLAEQFKTDLAAIKHDNVYGDLVITDSTMHPTFYIISGYTRESFFYQKVIPKNDVMAYAILYFDKTEKDNFKRFSGKILDSFQ
jgi:hypothetical protein